ncbi:MAG: hypothetical protein K9K39_06115 [Desulfohalobiaceae bacterium]|nr:hypothetical protein [Desulfohalobiaceae bacterium]
MRSTLTISIPEDIRQDLDRTSQEDGVSRSVIVQQSLRDYLFLRRFRDLRGRMVQEAAERGVFTDEDVFDKIS